MKLSTPFEMNGIDSDDLFISLVGDDDQMLVGDARESRGSKHKSEREGNPIVQ